jgi:ribosome maturation factor RimP
VVREILNSKPLSLLRELSREIAEREGLELVDVNLSAGGRQSLIRVVVYRPGGTSIDDCQRFSRALDTMLEVEELIQQPYTLEVSSPGLTRPLKSPADFARHRGKEIEVSYSSRDGKRQTVMGTIREVGKKREEILLDTKNGEEVIPLDAVTRARPVIDWKGLFRQRSEPETSQGNRDEQ